MSCSLAGVSGRQAVVGAPFGYCATPCLCPLPRSGEYSFVRQRKLRISPRALPDGEAARLAAESLGNLGVPHLHLADSANQVVNYLFSLADETAALVDSASATIDSASDVASSAAQATVDAATTAASTATDAASTTSAAAATKAGWFGFLADSFEGILKLIDGGLETLNVPYAYGFSIIILTLFVKILTFPLSKQQVESSVAMQQLQPRIQEIQTKYKNNPERLQQETAALYQEAGVNPLAGCLPTLATIPVFIGLYRSLTLAADEGLLNEGWFFIPSLAGPTTISARQAGMGTSWLFPFENGAPPIGWHDAGAYLILPALLIVSQVISQKIISPPKSKDPSQQQMQGFLAVLPFMLGWFSLNVPSGLTLYWITNNILSTGQQVYLKSQAKPPELAPMGTVVNPKVEIISTPTGAEMGSRRAMVIDVEAVPAEDKQQQGARFRARRAREAAKKAAEVADGGEASSTSKVEAPVANLGFVAPPDLSAEITPLTENLEKDIVEDSDEEVGVEDSDEEVIVEAEVVVEEEIPLGTSSPNGSGTAAEKTVEASAVEAAGAAGAAGAARASAPRGPKRKRGKKGKKGKKGGKKK